MGLKLLQTSWVDAKLQAAEGFVSESIVTYSDAAEIFRDLERTFNQARDRSGNSVRTFKKRARRILTLLVQIRPDLFGKTRQDAEALENYLITVCANKRRTPLQNRPSRR